MFRLIGIIVVATVVILILFSVVGDSPTFPASQPQQSHQPAIQSPAPSDASERPVDDKESNPPPALSSRATGDGCDEEFRSKITKRAFMAGKAADPLDPPEEPLPKLAAGIVLAVGKDGEPELVRDPTLQNSDLPVCVYSDSQISVYLPSSILTSRVREFMAGIRQPQSTFLGIPDSESRFEVFTYWSFKGIRPSWALWEQNAGAYRYEARQVLFDTDKKVALFTSDILTDGNGRGIAEQNRPERFDLSANPDMARIFDALDRILNETDRKAQMIRGTLQ